jgi:hypothetical protein
MKYELTEHVNKGNKMSMKGVFYLIRDDFNHFIRIIEDAAEFSLRNLSILFRIK